ncbi:MAG: TIGR02281 family clan AA aspartic protease [Paracoccaceae bacterium]
MDSDTIARLAYLGILLAALGGWVMVEYRGRLGFAMRSAMAWGMIFVGVMAGYGLWSDIRTTISPVQTITDNRIEVPRAEDGHYYLTLTIADTPIMFMVDTGASNVVLTKADARRLGIDPDALLYLGEANTANGVVRTARVKVDNIVLGPFQDARMDIWVNEGEMDGSLLGMDYLGLFHIEIAKDRMILTR